MSRKDDEENEAVEPKPKPKPKPEPEVDVEAEPKQPVIVVYGAEWCGACEKLKAYLDGAGFKYTSKDVEKEGVQAELDAKGAAAGVEVDVIPVIEIDGELHIGFDRRELGNLLGDPLVFAVTSPEEARAFEEKFDITLDKNKEQNVALAYGSSAGKFESFMDLHLGATAAANPQVPFIDFPTGTPYAAQLGMGAYALKDVPAYILMHLDMPNYGVAQVYLASDISQAIIDGFAAYDPGPMTEKWGIPIRFELIIVDIDSQGELDLMDPTIQEAAKETLELMQSAFEAPKEWAPALVDPDHMASVGDLLLDLGTDLESKLA